MSEHFRVARLLRLDSKVWWYHRELRQRGQAAEARTLEHKNVRDHIRMLRSAKECGGFLLIGHGGAIFNFAADSRLTGIRNTRWITEAGILTVDLRTVPDEAKIHIVSKWPSATVDTNPLAVALAGAHSLCDVRVSDLLPRYRAIGATITNDKGTDVKREAINA